jgi:mono/diheme cytochrome c family protein
MFTRNRSVQAAIGLILLLILAACAQAVPTLPPTALVPTVAPAPTRNPAGDAAQGVELFVKWRCVGCHAPDASGKVGPSLAGTQLSLAAFTGAVRSTRPPKPAFSEAELNEADVRDLYTWLSRLEAPAIVQPGQTAPLPEGQILGMKLYTESSCDRCHGAFAQGGSAPKLVGYTDNAPKFLSAMSLTTNQVPEHSLEKLDAGLMRRLHKWLQEGANPDSGC